jgi:hypothetical protein
MTDDRSLATQSGGSLDLEAAAPPLHSSGSGHRMRCVLSAVQAELIESVPKAAPAPPNGEHAKSSCH